MKSVVHMQKLRTKKVLMGFLKDEFKNEHQFYADPGIRSNASLNYHRICSSFIVCVVKDGSAEVTINLVSCLLKKGDILFYRSHYTVEFKNATENYCIVTVGFTSCFFYRATGFLNNPAKLNVFVLAGSCVIHTDAQRCAELLSLLPTAEERSGSRRSSYNHNEINYHYLLLFLCGLGELYFLESQATRIQLKTITKRNLQIPCIKFDFFSEAMEATRYKITSVMIEEIMLMEAKLCCETGKRKHIY